MSAHSRKMSHAAPRNMSHATSRASVSKSRSKSIAIMSRKSTLRHMSEPELYPSQSKLISVSQRAINRFDRRGVSNFSKMARGVASTVLSAYLGFKDPRKRRREYLIPKDKAAWLEWLVVVAKRRINVEYLTDK